MAKLILTVGAPGSGKTTWAEEYVRKNPNTVNLNRDDIRFKMFTNGVADWSKYKHKRSKETQVTEFVNEMVTNAIAFKQDIIISDTNLNEGRRENWKRLAESNGYVYEEVPFDVEWEELRRRNRLRANSVNESIVWSFYLKMNEYLGKMQPHTHVGNPKAVIIDIDGTIARMVNRSPYQYERVLDDVPRKFVLAMISGVLVETGAVPIFLSGRESVCYEDTRKWIEQNVSFAPKDFSLFMRAIGDRRKDFVVKEELFRNNVDNQYDVIGAFDDRAQVLSLWRMLDIPNIIDVSGDRYNEF